MPLHRFSSGLCSLRTLWPLFLIAFSLFSCDKEEKKPAASAEPIPSPPPVDAKFAPPPETDEAKRKEWLGRIEEEIKKNAATFDITPEGAGPWRACMPEDMIRKQTQIHLCPEKPIAENKRCFTAYQTGPDQPTPVELWTDGNRLVRIVIRTTAYRTKENIYVGEPLAKVRSKFSEIKYFKEDGDEWVAAVSNPDLRFSVRDPNAKTEEELDPFSKITRIEILFSCPETEP